MGIIDLFRRKKEENKIASQDREEYKQRLIMEMRLRGEKPVLKKIPEEIELEGYLEEERRDAIRALVVKKRAERSMFGCGGTKINMPNPRANVNIKPKSQIKLKPNKYSFGRVW